MGGGRYFSSELVGMSQSSEIEGRESTSELASVGVLPALYRAEPHERKGGRKTALERSHICWLLWFPPSTALFILHAPHGRGGGQRAV